MTVAVLNTMMRPLIEERLPDWIEPHWFSSTEELYALAPQAEIGWFDNVDIPTVFVAARRGERLRWINTVHAGVNGYPLAQFAQQGTVLTNGAGIHAVPIAEFTIMGMLAIAKNWRAIIDAQDRHEWLRQAPGRDELFGSTALIIGFGGIGSEIHKRLVAFGVECTLVRRTPGEGVLGPDAWQGELGRFDWVIIAVPSTPETDGMFGAAELAAMKPSARLVNVARGSVIDQPALVAALEGKRIGGALLDVTAPEPLPPDHPLWSLDNAHVTMHLSGRAESHLFARAADRFIDNLVRWERGEPLNYVVDLALGY